MTAWNRWHTPSREMEFGVFLPTFERGAHDSRVGYADLLALALKAEELGFASVWLPDHFLFRPPVMAEGDEYGLWEAWTAAAAIAQATTKIQIGLMVTCLGWRNPGIVARMTETIEEISGGRFVLGVGAGWHKPEYDAYGLPFDHRVGRFEDSITILDELLRTGRSSYDGRWFQTNDAISQPRGPRAEQGGPPILVGSSGDRMLGLIAKYADAWNTNWLKDASGAAEPMAALDRALADAGRDLSSIVRTTGSVIALQGSDEPEDRAMQGSPTEIAAKLRAFREIGFHHFIGWLDPATPDAIAEFRAIIDLIED